VPRRLADLLDRLGVPQHLLPRQSMLAAECLGLEAGGSALSGVIAAEHSKNGGEALPFSFSHSVISRLLF
jgi:hypothetical protein